MHRVGWNEHHGGVVIRFPDPKKDEPPFLYNNKVAAFNLDNTLIQFRMSMTFDRYKCDLIYQNSIQRLQDFHRQGYSIVIIGNQDAVERGFMTIEDLQIKFNLFIALCKGKFPLLGIFTTKNNCFKKPHTWTWRLLELLYKLSDKKFENKESFYVGNHTFRRFSRFFRDNESYVDRAYAHNIGIEFRTAEEVFRYGEKKITPLKGVFDNLEKDIFIKMEMDKYRNSVYYKTKNFYIDILTYCNDRSKEYFINNAISGKVSFVMITVGPPSSGKSTLSRKLAESISQKVLVNGKEVRRSPIVVIKDKHRVDNTLLSDEDRMALIDEMIQFDRIVILDGNYPTHESRKVYMQKASTYKVPVIFVKINTPYKVCRHFNHMKLESTNNYSAEPNPIRAFRKYNRLYQVPDCEKYKREIPGLHAFSINVPILILDSKSFRDIY